MDAEAVRQVFLDFARVGKILEGDEDARCARMVEALKARLVERSRDVLARARHQAVLFSYASDATAFLVQGVATAKLGDSHIVRKGKILHAFLMQRGVLVTIDPSGRRTGS
jgi:ABC-type hemin transport system substrate-binding protein